MVERIKVMMNGLGELLQALVDRQTEQKFRWLGRVWILLLYVWGVFFWGTFFDWTRAPLDFEDWGVINAPRLDFFSDALRSGRLPLHMVYEKFAGQVFPLHFTDRFFAVPDAITTPQILLLRWLTVNQFVLVDVLIHFSIATAGLLWFRRRYHLSLLAYGMLFLLFNFNGYIQAHYGVGHATWAGYFLFPWFVVLMIEFVERQPDWRWVCKTAFLLCYMVLVGSQHHFTWALIFLGVLGLVCWQKFAWVLKAGLFAGLLSAVRLLPPVLILRDVYESDGVGLLPGYPTLLDVLRSMAVIADPANRNFVPTGVEWLSHWEFNIYVGVLGTVFVLYFGLYRWVRSGELQALLPSTLVVFVFTIGSMYAVMRELQIPLFDGERVPSRMIGLPLAVFIVMAAVQFQAWLDAWQTFSMAGVTAGLALFVLTANDLWRHAQEWNVAGIRAAFGPAQMALAGSSVGNHPDQPYFTVIIIGTALSSLTGLFLFYRAWREQRAAGSMA